MESFFGETCVLHALKRTTVDYVVGHISLVFELVFTESVRIAAAQGYLDRLMNYQSQNPYTLEQFKQIREHMARYISKRINQERYGFKYETIDRGIIPENSIYV